MSSRAAHHDSPELHRERDPDSLARVSVRPGTGQDIVALAGELDMATAPRLSPVIHCLLAQGRNRITVNLDAVTFMDASALSALIMARRDVTRSKGSLTITDNPLCARLLAMTGLTTLFHP
jgi:anti-anti-sigma factor